MTNTVTDIDELEALLADLDPPKAEATLEESTVVEQAAEKPALPKPPSRAARDKAAAKAAETSEADLDAALEGLDDLDLDPTVVSTQTQTALPPDEDLDFDPETGLDADLVDVVTERAATADSSTEVDLDALLAGMEDPTPEVATTDAVVGTINAEAFEIKPGGVAIKGAAVETKSQAADEIDKALDARIAVLTPRPVSFIFKPTGPLETFIDADQLQRDLHFTESSITVGMTRQASLFAHYSTLAAQAKYQADRCKQQVELVYANLDQQLRDDLTTSGTKFTEKVIEAMIQKDSTYQSAQSRAFEAKAVASMVETAADSFRHRKDMLIQVGADLRQQRDGEMRMLEKTHPGKAAMENLSK